MEGILEAMMFPYLTISEAAQKTNRSSSTIRRVIRSIADNPSNDDRSGIEPTPKAVEAFKKKGENFTWKIREDILLKNLHSALKSAVTGCDGGAKLQSLSSSKIEKDILQILRQELHLKNRQIEKQWEVIQSLNDRLREGNILMGSLQRRLAPPQADSPSPVAVNASSMESERRSFGEGEASIDVKRASRRKVKDVEEKLVKKASMKTSKKGVFSWLFS